MASYNESYNPHTSTNPNIKMMELVEQDKKILERLRNNVLNLNRLVENMCNKDGNVELAKKTFKDFSDQIQQDYESLENDAITLQQHTLVNPEMSRLQTFLLDALADPANNEIYQKAVKAANSHDTTNAYYSFAVEFLKFSTSAHNSRSVPKLTPQIYYNNQTNFEEYLTKWPTSQGRNNIFKITFLERGICGSVVEFRIFHQTSQPATVLKMKMLFLVNNGQFEYVQIMAPHEEWGYTDSTRSQVDISVQSKYECYQRLSEHTNAACSMISTSTYAQFEPKVYINHFLIMFMKFPTFEVSCRNCKRFLRDFMPPLFDQRDRRICYHPHCR